MKQFLSKAAKASAKALSYVRRNRRARSFKQAVSDYGILLCGLAFISIGAFAAYPVAGWIVMGVLTVLFNERISN